MSETEKYVPAKIRIMLIKDKRSGEKEGIVTRKNSRKDEQRRLIAWPENVDERDLGIGTTYNGKVYYRFDREGVGDYINRKRDTMPSMIGLALEGLLTNSEKR